MLDIGRTVVGKVPVATFSGLVVRDAVYDGRGAGPAESQPSRHLEAALGWLCRAQDEAGGGVSYGFSLRGGWREPYLETTGYIIPTLFDAARATGDPALADRAVEAARWLLRVQNADGGFANFKYGDDGIVFDTGQCIFGLVSAFEETGVEEFLGAARKAGDWLSRALGEDDHWARFEHRGVPHVYNTRTAWALLVLHAHSQDPSHREAALRNLRWAVGQQLPSGFFENNAFRSGDAPYTHNISYAICGLQESGWLLEDPELVSAARRCSDALLTRMTPDGFIPGQIWPDGTPRTTSYSCLTGQAQLSVVWARQHLRSGEPHLAEAAARSLSYVKRHQRIGRVHPGVDGAIAGSFPIWGRYAPFSFPNWATKFYVDALLLEPAVSEGR